MSELEPASAPDDDGRLRIVRFGDLHEPQDEAPRRAHDALRPAEDAEVAGGANGLDRVKMLDAIDGLRATGLAIETLEVVRAVCDQPQYTIERHSYERGMGESPSQWCMRSHHLARDLVATFDDPADGSVRFVLTTVDTEEQRKAA